MSRNAADETSIEVLGRLVGAQRREAEDSRGAISALTQRVNSLSGVMVSQFGNVERALTRTQKSVSAIHIGNRLSSSTAELSGRDRVRRHAVLHILRRHGDDLARTWVRHYGTRGQRQELDDGAVPVLRGSKDELQTRATQGPATIAVPAWAGVLSAIDLADFLLEAPRPSAFAQLSAMGTQLQFLNSSIPVPIIPVVPSGAWVQEGGPIPAAMAPLSNAVLSPRKVAVLASFLNELRDLSTPSIESALEFILGENLKRVIDNSLVDVNPATALRPAGLRSGVAALVPSVLLDPQLAMIADIKALMAAILAAGGTEIVLILNPAQAINFATFVGTGLPLVIVTPSLPAATVIAVDAPSFVSALGPPRLSVAGEATIHSETIPAPLSVGGIVATPQRSLLQTDASALRVIVDASWVVAGPTAGPTKRVAWMNVTSW